MELSIYFEISGINDTGRLENEGEARTVLKGDLMRETLASGGDWLP